MVNSYHQKTFIILKLHIMSKSNVKILQCKQNIWKENYNKGYLKDGDAS